MDRFTPRQVLAQFENWSQDIAGIPIADTGWFGPAVYEQFLSARATLISQQVDKDPNTINKFVQQTIGCIELEEARVEDCPCAPPSGCTWFKSTLQLPTPIKIVSVSSIGGNLSEVKTYTYKDWQSVKYPLQSRILAERTRGYYTIKNNYLYIITEQVKVVSLAGIFFDPVETQRFPLCGQFFSDCQPFLDYDLYIDPALYQTTLALTFQTIQGMKSTQTFDTKNNAQPTVGADPV